MKDRKISILGVPMDLGRGRRGVDMGPSAMRIAGLEARLAALGVECEDLGNVPVGEFEASEVEGGRARFLHAIASACAELRDRVREILEAERTPLVIGGDHSIACGTVAGVSDFHHARGERVGLLWFDAHGDMNTPETTPSGNVHGMPLAAILGHGAEPLTGLSQCRPAVDPDKTVLIGVRSLDPGERELIRESGVLVFTMREVDALGMRKVSERALDVVTRGTAGFHLSFDLDGLDPQVAPGVGTPVRGGIDYREAHLFLELVAESRKLISLEVTELDPILDERNRTAETAVDLVLSALGQSVL